MPISERTEGKLRQAMQRLLDGQPLRSNGALTKENLAREAGVSHATVYRAEDILAEWNDAVSRPVLRTPGEVRRDDEIERLRKQLRNATREITALSSKLDALAAVTANLYHENQGLKRRLRLRSGT